MDLHVVEVRVQFRPAGPTSTRDVDGFRAAGVYAVAGGRTTYQIAKVDADEVADDPIATLGQLGGRIADAVAAGVTAREQVLVTGGNCTALPGVIGGLQQAFGPTTRIGLVWFDAHGDFNTPRTTPSGMLGGMPVAVSAGLCYAPWRTGAKQAVPLPTDRIVLVDVRNLDPDEERLIRATDATVVPVQGTALTEAVEHLAAQTDVIDLHIDLDVLDQRFGPTLPTKEPNGPDIDQTLAAIETVLQTSKVGVISFVAVYTDGEGGGTTLNSAIELLRGTLSRWRVASEA